MNLAYTRAELLRTLRNRQAMFFSLGFPLVLYIVIAGPNKGEQDFGGTGVPTALYYMASLASFGTMNAIVASGARIAVEREAGWTRQLRISPLSTTAYFLAKLVTGFALAGSAVALLYLAGTALGVRLSGGRWLEMTGLMVVGLVPFAALGILLGQLIGADAIGPAIGGGIGLLALISGTWFPITSGFIYDVGRLLPSWWLVQAGRAGIGGGAWPLLGWVVVTVWTVALTALAFRAYRRDTAR